MDPSQTPVLRYRPRPRPEWVRGANAMGRASDAKHVAPPDAQSLQRSAMQNTGSSDFGDDDWREPIRIRLDDLASEPEGRYGHHAYATADPDPIAAERERWRPLRGCPGVRSEL